MNGMQGGRGNKIGHVFVLRTSIDFKIQVFTRLAYLHQPFTDRQDNLIINCN